MPALGANAVTRRGSRAGVLGLTAPQEADEVREEPCPEGRGEKLGDPVARKWQSHVAQTKGEIDVQCRSYCDHLDGENRAPRMVLSLKEGGR